MTDYPGKALDEVNFTEFSEPYSGCENFPSMTDTWRGPTLPLSVCMQRGSHPDTPPTTTLRTRHSLFPPTEVPVNSLFIASLVRSFTISP